MENKSKERKIVEALKGIIADGFVLLIFLSPHR